MVVFNVCFELLPYSLICICACVSSNSVLIPCTVSAIFSEDPLMMYFIQLVIPLLLNLQETERRTLKRKTDAVSTELRLANRSLVKVRKAQLQQLLEKEKKQFETELKSIGLVYYQERL